MKSSVLPTLRDVLLRVFVARQAILAVVIMLTLIFAAYYGGQALAQRQIQETRLLAHSIETYIEHAGRVLHAVAAMSPSSQAMEAIRSAYGYFDVLYHLDTQGKLLAISPQDPQFPLGMDLSAQPYYQPTATEWVISEPFISIRTGNPTVYLTFPLANEQGLIVGEMSLTDLQKTVIISNEALTGIYIVTDRSGRFLAHPNYELVRRQADLGAKEIVRYRQERAAQRMYRVDGQWVLGTSVPIQNMGWFAINQTRISTIYGPFLIPIFVVSILGSLVMGWLVWRQQVAMNREVVAPLLALSHEAEHLAEGEFSESAPLVSAPSVYEEIHSLGQSFERMKQAVQSRETALRERLAFETLLSELSAAFVNVPVDIVDQTVELWLQRIAEFWETDASVLMEFSPDANKLYAAYSYTMTESPNIFVDTLSAKFSWYTETLKRGENVILNSADDLPEEATAERTFAQQGIIFSHVALPLTMGGNPFGAIGLADFHLPRTWSQAGLQRLRLMGEVLMMAVVRKRSEEEREQLLVQIQARARQVQQIMDTVPEGVILLDSAANILLANPMGENHLKVLANAQIGGTLTELGERPLAEILTSPPKGLWHEVEFGRHNYQVIARSFEIGPTPMGWVIVTRDVTQQREFDQRVQRQERLAAVGQLAAGIAHDFNNIMATIVLYAQMTSRLPGLSDHVRARMDTINQQAHHATELIQQILDFSRRSALERQPLDLLPVFKEHVKLLERTLPENIRVELEYDHDVYTVNADPTRIQQVLTNLAVNARDAMPEGGTLRFTLARLCVITQSQLPLPEMSLGTWIKIAISDTGTGIPAKVMERLYEPFVTTKAPGKGTGLGLSQVHGIVMAHEGHIALKTRPGYGTTFTIYLPALQETMSEKVCETGTEVTMGHGETLLVVEDNPATRAALVESLENLNYQVIATPSAEAALDRLTHPHHEISLVLSDVVMPGMSGVALVHTMQERAMTPKVILLTGHPLERELEELMKEELSRLATWLLKPVTLEKLGQIIANALGK